MKITIIIEVMLSTTIKQDKNKQYHSTYLFMSREEQSEYQGNLVMQNDSVGTMQMNGPISQ